jgi:hypothetical protein
MQSPTPLELLQGVSIAVAMRDSPWLYPLVQTAHMLGFIVLVGAALMFDLRILGVSRRIPVRLLAAHLLTWSMASLIVIIPAGLLLFLADAASLVANPAFVMKMGLLACAGVNAVAFRLGPYRSVADWDLGTPAPPQARWQALLSMLLWISVVASARAVAYV